MLSVPVGWKRGLTAMLELFLALAGVAIIAALVLAVGYAIAEWWDA